MKTLNELNHLIQDTESARLDHLNNPFNQEQVLTLPFARFSKLYIELCNIANSPETPDEQRIVAEEAMMRLQIK